MLQVCSREIKYPRNLISGGSETTFYHKKNSYNILLSQKQPFLIYNNNTAAFILVSFNLLVTSFSALK